MIKMMLATFVNGNTADWDIYLSSAIFAYNTAMQETTRSSPYALVYGHEVAVPIDQLLRSADQDPTPVNLSSYAQALHRHLRDTNTAIKDNIAMVQRRQQQAYDMRLHSVPFRVNDLVMLNVPASTPLQPKWTGPSIICKVKLPNIIHTNVTPSPTRCQHHSA